MPIDLEVLLKYLDAAVSLRQELYSERCTVLLVVLYSSFE